MDEILKELNDLLDDSQAVDDFLSEVIRIEPRARKALESQEKLLEELKSPTESERMYELTRTDTLAEAPNIFKREVESAVTKNTEYAYMPFLSPLLDLAKFEDLYEITTTGSGWNRKIVVRLKMDEIAGTIDDYASAVDAAREEMGANPDRDPIKASKIWRTKIWPTRGGSGPYQHVIGTRLALSSVGGLGDAPYWSLLNYGNKSVKMSSDIGGTAYPSHGGTRFVENTEKKIADYFKLLFSTYRDENVAALNIIEESINSFKEALKRMENTVNDMVGKNMDTAAKIAPRLRTRVVDDIDPRKLAIAREKIRSGSLLPGQRINVGVRGRRVRLSYSTLAD